MKETEQRTIDELARRAIEQSVASVKDPGHIPLPAFRTVSPPVSDRPVMALRGYFSPFPLVAAMLSFCLVIPPLFVGPGTELSHITAVVHRRGEFERCFNTAHDIVVQASVSRYNQPRR